MTRPQLPPSPSRSERWNYWVKVRPTWFHRVAHSILLGLLGYAMFYGFMAWTGRKTFDDALALFGALAGSGVIIYGVAYGVCEIQVRRDARHDVADAA